MSKIINKTLANDREYFLYHDYIKLFSKTLNPLFENISYKLSHVLLAPKSEAESLLSLKKAQVQRQGSYIEWTLFRQTS